MIRDFPCLRSVGQPVLCTRVACCPLCPLIVCVCVCVFLSVVMHRTANTSTSHPSSPLPRCSLAFGDVYPQGTNHLDCQEGRVLVRFGLCAFVGYVACPLDFPFSCTVQQTHTSLPLSLLPPFFSFPPLHRPILRDFDGYYRSPRSNWFPRFRSKRPSHMVGGKMVNDQRAARIRGDGAGLPLASPLYWRKEEGQAEEQEQAPKVQVRRPPCGRDQAAEDAMPAPRVPEGAEAQQSPVHPDG